MGISGICITYNVWIETCRWSLFVLIFLSNALTIVTLLKTKHGIGQKGKWYIISLSVADILISPTVGIDSTLNRFGIYCPERTEEAVWKKRVVYIVLSILYAQSLGCSLLALMSIAIDRLVAVSKPIFYRNNVTPFKIKCLLLGQWIYIFTLTTTFLTYFGWKTDADQVLEAYQTLQVIPTWCYDYIFTPHVYFIILANLAFYAVTLLYLRKLDANRCTNGRKFETTKRYLKMSGVTLTTMLTLWAPYILVNIYVEKQHNRVPPWINEYGIHLAFTLMFCNSWVNPFLYCWLNKDYREAFSKVLGISKNKVRAMDSTTQVTSEL
ncbi:hypothetical protein CAPTEDRAFT_193352 [Capitella teleta]|uniref:G-protein coupled receptors family 1 profile domain-containing protein n=1 Tax=Capitella teleta TaxID=283909 RepID=R7V301_CAPTE|nr:hypothetical protein CAPTEDRAFT_193352 [Capitella teleta]|eukprot:ELU10051.1 hypothetical protein CAPTEDRAFT_193352 [Capitella teleta]